MADWSTSSAATLIDAVAHRARATPDAPALADAHGRLGYGALQTMALRMADDLRAAGLGAGDVIGVQLPNSRAFVVTLLAAGAIGATVQMLHMPYRRTELAALLRHARSAAFVGLARFKDEAPLEQVAALGVVPRIIDAATIPVDPATTTRATTTPAPAGTRPAAQFAAPDPDTRYVLLHTSGTTAEPKAVPVSHRQFLGNAAAALDPLGVLSNDVLLPAAPFTHLYGLFVLEMGLLAGACVSLLPAFTPADFVATILRDDVTAVFGGPAHFKSLPDADDATAAALARLRLVCLSGTAVPEALAAALEQRMPAGRVIQLWGMSELQAGSYGRPGDPVEIRHATAGRASPGTEFRVRPIEADSSSPDLPPGREGRLWVRSPSLFGGYLDNPAATAAALRDGWFDTGDTALLTDDGALVLTGRVKEIINRGGVKFNPLDIEAAIDRMPGVARSAVVPMPDPVLGERACVFIEAMTRGGAVPTLDQVQTELRDAGIARFKWPERVEAIGQMPLTPTQKIMRGRLTALLQDGSPGRSR